MLDETMSGYILLISSRNRPLCSISGAVTQDFFCGEHPKAILP